MGCITQSFVNVPVVAFPRHVPRGGPIWPDFDAQTTARHCYNGKPADRAASWPKEATTETLEEAVWGGFLDPGFGHLVAEHLSRVRWALRVWPDKTFLFTVAPGTTRADLGGWVWQVFAWIGLPADQVRIVDAPLKVRRLFVAAQDEMLGKLAPSDAYLDLLDGFTDRLQPTPTDLLYVSRQGMVVEGNGGHAGEDYLVKLLLARGVTVLNPRQADLMTQLRAYAGAGHLVFAEGSAVHGRQLLGRLPQCISVLIRRPGAHLAENALAPRVKALTYAKVGAATALKVYYDSGKPRPGPSLRFYDVRRLHSFFRDIGQPIDTDWDQQAYRCAAMADIEGWVKSRSVPARLMREYRPILRKIGLMPEALRRKSHQDRAALVSAADSNVS
jgi:hypothetical protein